MRYAIVRDNIVVNVVEQAAGSTWTPPEGTALVVCPIVETPQQPIDGVELPPHISYRGNPGDGYEDGVFSPAPDPPAPTPTRRQELLDIGRDNWTDAQQKELIEILAGE